MERVQQEGVFKRERVLNHHKYIILDEPSGRIFLNIQMSKTGKSLIVKTDKAI